MQKVTRQLLGLSLLLLFCTGTVFAAGGQIHGVISDSNTGEFLPGANVFIKGTAIGSSTNLNGEYLILNIPPGQYTLVVSYIGYETKERPIKITVKSSLKQDIHLDFSIIDLSGDAVVITAQREGQIAAINQQIRSDAMVNVVARERIEELPDANAAESVGRLPGVAVQRSGGEAQTLMIRGLESKFVAITVNGIEIPSSDSETRSVNLSMISQDALGGIELFKAITPDHDADAIAGTVNLVTGKARKEDNPLTLDLMGSYNDLINTYEQYKFSGRYRNRFFTDKVGVQASLHAEKRDRSSETAIDSWFIPPDLDYEISNLGLTFNDVLQKRYGGELTLDYNTPDRGNIKFINVYNEKSKETMSSFRSYPASSGDEVNYNPTYSESKAITYNNSFIGENNLYGMKINWALAHAYTEAETPFNFYMRFRESNTTTTGMKNISDRDTLKLPGHYLIPYAFNKFDNAGLDRTYFTSSDNDDRNLVAKLDIEAPFNLSKSLGGFIKFGFKSRRKVRHRDYDRYMGAYWLRDTQPNVLNADGASTAKDWSGTYWADSPYSGKLTDFLSASPYPSRMIYDDYLLYPLYDKDKVIQWYEFNKNGISEDGFRKEYVYLLESNRNKYTVKENVNAAFIMSKLNLGQKLSLIAGVRYEAENNEYTGKFAPEIVGFLEGQGGIIKDSTTTFDKGLWLPNVHLRYKPFKSFDIRLAATKSLSRPDFQMRLPALYVNRQDGEIEMRNPNLKTAKSWNYDASMSFYTTDYGLFTVSGFYKEIEDMFYWLNDIFIVNTDYGIELGLPEEFGPYNQYSLNMPVNTDETRVWGFELDVQSHLGFLPGFFKNFVVNANYSRIWSETKYPAFRLERGTGFPPPPPIPIFYDEQRELTGQTDYTGNVSVGYDSRGFSGRLSLYFQGPSLASVSSFPYLDTYYKSFTRLDLSLKQQITSNLALFVFINNLTDMVEGTEYHSLPLDRGGTIYGYTVDAGLRITL